MKKILLLAAGFLPFILSAQIISDDFESYSAGDMLAATSPIWTTWSGGAADDAPVSNAQASSESNSLYIKGNNGPADIVLPFPSDYTSGVYEFSLKMYVVAGKGAYYNLQQSSVPGVNWMMELYLDIAGGGYLQAGGATPTVTYTPDAWNDTKTVVDLDNDVATFFMNGSLVYTWQWSLGATGAGAEKMFGGVDIFAYAANGSDAEFYVDDVLLKSLSVCTSPTGPSVSDVTATTANLQWDAVDEAVSYKIVYRAAGSTTQTFKKSPTNSKVLNGLSPSTTYKWGVQTICSIGPLIASTYTPGPDFTTAPLRLGEEALYEAGIFPNPASESATISFALEESSPVMITLVDMNGRVLQEVENAVYTNGIHQLSFSTSKVSPGLYLLKLTTNEEVVTKRLTIVN